MRLEKEIGQMERAEQLFSHFMVYYDPDELQPVRLLVLKRFREYVAEIDRCHPEGTDNQVRDWYADALLRSYKDCTTTPETIRKDMFDGPSACSSCSGGCDTIGQTPLTIG